MTSSTLGKVWTVHVLAIIALTAGCGGGGGGGGGGGSFATTPAADAAASTLTLDRSSGVTADGRDAVKVTATLLDSSGNAVSGASINLTTSFGATFDTPSVSSDTTGTAIAHLTATSSGSYTITATVGSGKSAVILATHPSVQFDAASADPSASRFDLSPSSVKADGTSSATLRVTAIDQNGVPLAGVHVSFSATGSSDVIIQPSGLTGPDGVATGSLASTQAGGQTVTATLALASGSTSLTGQVTFQAGSLDMSHSSLTVSPSTGIAADGHTTATIQVQVADGAGNPLPGAQVTLAATGTGNTITQPGTTGSSGTVSGTLASTQAESKTITATISVAGTNGTLTGTALFTAPFDGAGSSVSATPAGGIVADGVSKTTITVTVLDATGKPVPGVQVTLSASGAGNTIVQPAAPTGATGTTTGTLASTTSGTKTISASLALATSTSSIQGTVTFVPGALDTTRSAVIVTPPTGVVSDGNATAAITIDVTDANGNGIPGASVSVAASGTGNTITQPAAVTGATGTATATIASTRAETKTITVTVNSAATQFVLATTPTVTFVLPSPRYTFVANATDATVMAFRVDAGTGRLLPHGYLPTGGAGPSALATDRAGRFLYCANTTAGTIAQISIDPSSGALAAIAPPAAAGSAPQALAVHPSGKFLYAACTGSNNVTTFSIAANGSLGATGSALAGTGPRALAIDPTGQFLYVSNDGSSDVSAYTINATTGALTSIGANVAAGLGPDSLAIDGTGAFLYVANQGASSVSAYTINPATGALTANGAFGTGTAPKAIAADPTGQFVYVANGGSANVSAFAINAGTGTLASLGTAAAGTNPQGIAIDPSGRLVYVANDGDDDVQEYTIAPGGSLTSLGTLLTHASPSAVAVSGGATPLAFHATFVYAGNRSDNTVSIYSANATTGLLTPAGSAPTGNQPRAVAVDKTNRILFVANASAANVQSFAIDAATGGLTQTSAFASPNGPIGLTIDPSNRFLFVVNGGTTLNNFASTVQSFAIGPTGGLSPVGPEVPCGANAQAAGLDPTGRFLYVANFDSDDVATFSINLVSGALTQVGANTSIGSSGTSFAVDSSGRWGVVTIAPLVGKGTIASVANSAIQVFSIDPTTGALTAVGVNQFSGGGSPIDCRFSPSGQFLYVVNNGTALVAGFSLDPATGNVAPGPGMGTGGAPEQMAFDLSGRFAYVANRTGNSTSEFTVDPVGGTLSGGSQIAAGVQPRSVVVLSTNQ